MASNVNRKYRHVYCGIVHKRGDCKKAKLAKGESNE